MACSGCQRRREWLKKWMKVAYERANRKPTNGNISVDGSNQPANSGNHPPGRVE